MKREREETVLCSISRLSARRTAGIAVLVAMCGLITASAMAAPPISHTYCNPIDGDCCVGNIYEICTFAGINMGEGNHCLGDQACCMPNGDCEIADGLCCEAMGGVAVGPNSESVCYQAPNICDSGGPDEGACCDEVEGVCRNFAEANCQGVDEVWTYGVDCDDLDPECGTRACCLPIPFDPLCQTLPPDECILLGGEPQDPGTNCDDGDDNDGVAQECDNCPDHYNPSQDDSDGDGLGDECDNCIFVTNPGQENADGDWWGDVCDNCPYIHNNAQTDSDAECDGMPWLGCVPYSQSGGLWGTCPGEAECLTDGYGDYCDNCPNILNENQANEDGDDHGDVCDNCPSVPNNDQANQDGDSCGDVCDDCDGDPDKCEEGICGCGVPDIDTDEDGVYDCHDNCITVQNPGQENCDGDDFGDACDDDDDNDGVTDVDDVCDFTPPVPTAGGGDIVRDVMHPLYGTLLGDLDGDCDVDEADLAILNQNTTGTGCLDGQNVGEGCARRPMEQPEPPPLKGGDPIW